MCLEESIDIYIAFYLNGSHRVSLKEQVNQCGTTTPMPLFLFILVQYSNKFMHSILLHSIVLRRSQLYCIVNLLLCGYNTIQCYA